MLAAATAGHQVEGNNRYSDYWVIEHLRHSSFVEPSDQADDHYHHFKEDIDILKRAGLNAYRFSIEWARIEPHEGQFDEKEMQNYREVLQYCRQEGIEPVVTLFHFASPAWLIQKGGWGKPYVIHAFENYVRYLGEQLGDLFSYVCTINEANMGYQLKKTASDVMKQSKRKGSAQVGAKLDVGSLLFGMIEQGRAFHVSPLHVNTFLNPRSKEQEQIVMRAHQQAAAALKKKNPNIKAGLTLSLYDYQIAEELSKKKDIA